MYWSAAATGLVPPGVVTRTSTVPAASAGADAVTVVALMGVTFDAATPPNVTADAPLNAEPVMVTDVPPAVVPDVGLIPETEGGTVLGTTTAEEGDDAGPVPTAFVATTAHV